MQLKKNTKKQNKNCVQKLKEQLILNNEESTELDHNIRNYIFNFNMKNELKEYIIQELKNTERYKKGTNKNVEKKCEKIAGDYLENSKNWTISEGVMCIVAYIFTLVTMIDTVLRDICSEYAERIHLDSMLFLLCVVLILMSMLINNFKKSNKKFQLFVEVFNRFSPTIIMLTLTIFYFVRGECLYSKYIDLFYLKTFLSTVVIIVSFLIMICLIIIKCFEYKEQSKSES